VAMRAERAFISAYGMVGGSVHRNGPRLTGVSRLRVTAPIRTVVVVRPLAQPREGAFVGNADDASVACHVSCLEDEGTLRAAHRSLTNGAGPAVADARESTEVHTPSLSW